MFIIAVNFSKGSMLGLNNVIVLSAYLNFFLFGMRYSFFVRFNHLYFYLLLYFYKSWGKELNYCFYLLFLRQSDTFLLSAADSKTYGNNPQWTLLHSFRFFFSFFVVVSGTFRSLISYR